jgi:Ca-activated chloride channel family protein
LKKEKCSDKLIKNLLKKSGVIMKLTTIIFALLFITALSFPQTGTISGTVTDSLTGEALIGTNIIIEGTSIGAATDLNGRFVLKVSPGTYSLIITYIGYERKKIENIKVEPGKKIDFNVKLNPMQIVGECVTVTGHAKGQLQSINQQLSSNIITNIVSAETIRELPEDFNTEEYAYIVENNFKDAVKNPLSTFSIDVDAASYSNTRRFLMDGRLPPKDAVRVEEFINYFDYNYPLPESDLPFKIYTEYSYCPWNEDNYLVHIGIKGKELIKDENIPSSLTFLIDVSGSMSPPNKLPLLKRAFKMLVGQLKKDDKIAIVVYAGAAGLVLPSTYGSDKEKLLDAIDQLEAGGSTAGGQGIMLAYKIAKENYIKDGNNRVILATDGDFNIGITNTGELVHFLDDKHIFL